MVKVGVTRGDCGHCVRDSASLQIPECPLSIKLGWLLQEEHGRVRPHGSFLSYRKTFMQTTMTQGRVKSVLQREVRKKRVLVVWDP